MSLVLKIAIAMFAALPVEHHGVCRLYAVHREPAYANYWWACGSCYWDHDEKPFFYMATMLMACTDKTCVRVIPSPKNVDRATCELELQKKSR